MDGWLRGQFLRGSRGPGYPLHLHTISEMSPPLRPSDLGWSRWGSWAEGVGEADFLGRALPERPPPSSLPDWFFNLPPRGSLWSSCLFPFPILHPGRVSRWLYLSKTSSKSDGEATSIRTLIFNMTAPSPSSPSVLPAPHPRAPRLLFS